MGQPFDWLGDRIARLMQLQSDAGLPFGWNASGGASDREIDLCEREIGITLSPGHRALLKKLNGVEVLLTCRPGEGVTFFIFDTVAIVAQFRDLRSSYDAHSRAELPGALWDRLIPVIDLEDFEFCVAEPQILTHGEYAMLFASNELGPEWWRRSNYVAPSFETLLLLMMDRVAFARRPPYFWIG